MKITKVKTYCLTRLHEPERQWITASYRTIKADCALVAIETDEGLTGIGEPCAYGVPFLIREKVEWLSHEMVGRELDDPMLTPHPNGSSRAWDTAVAGIDAALWDLRGKVAGKPVCELLTQNPQKRIRLYASSGCRYDWRHSPDQLMDEALEYMDAGYTAWKIRLGTTWAWDGVTVSRFLDHMRKLREIVGGRMDLMLDGNQRLSEPEAAEITLELDRLGFAWFEEPIPRTEIDGYCRLNNSVAMPISGGEGMTAEELFEPYLERRAYDIVQPDAGLCGISECLRIGRAARRFGVDLVPHNWHNGLMTMANAHLVAALSNPIMLELCMIQGPLQWDILREKPEIQDGYLEIPDRPGIGVDLAEDLEERFPYIEGHYAITIQR
ncbi:MAG: mandelate racemase/muconate lactonizing enzyme family protein [Planctomycetota bacterium]|nr:mandelate racemase/muconate lactonizing enzyme family protein [Planctomycetota bacterium]